MYLQLQDNIYKKIRQLQNAHDCKGRYGRLAGGTVTPLQVPSLSDPNRPPTTYPSAVVSGKDEESEDSERSDTLLLDLENEDCESLFIMNESDGWSDDISSIQVNKEDNGLNEFFKDGL